jgi:hypothetical protein
VGASPQNAPVERIDFPPPAALRASTFPASGRGEVGPLTADSIDAIPLERLIPDALSIFSQRADDLVQQRQRVAGPVRFALFKIVA